MASGVVCHRLVIVRPPAPRPLPACFCPRLGQRLPLCLSLSFPCHPLLDVIWSVIVQVVNLVAFWFAGDLFKKTRSARPPAFQEGLAEFARLARVLRGRFDRRRVSDDWIAAFIGTFPQQFEVAACVRSWFAKQSHEEAKLWMLVQTRPAHVALSPTAGRVPLADAIRGRSSVVTNYRGLCYQVADDQ